MERFAALTGRRYGLFEYVGRSRRRARHRASWARAPRPSHETVDYLTARGEKVGVLKVRLYRPFSRRGVPRRAAADRPHASPCSTARRSRARSATRSIST